MSLYESTCVIRHDMSAQQVEQLAESFSEIIKDNGGAITKTEHWGLRTLAYRIKKNRKAHYVFFNVDAPAPAMRELERNLRLSEDVLRYLTLRVDEFDPDPSPIMQLRSSRDERSRRGEQSHDGKKAADAASVSEAESGDDAEKPAGKAETENTETDNSGDRP